MPQQWKRPKNKQIIQVAIAGTMLIQTTPPWNLILLTSHGPANFTQQWIPWTFPGRHKCNKNNNSSQGLCKEKVFASTRKLFPEGWDWDWAVDAALSVDADVGVKSAFLVEWCRPQVGGGGADDDGIAVSRCPCPCQQKAITKPHHYHEAKK